MAEKKSKSYDLRNKLARMNVRNRRRAMGVTCLGLAAGLVVLCGWRLWAFIEERQAESIEAYLKQFGEPTVELVSGLAGALFAAIGIILGIRFIAFGISCLPRVGTPANIPGHFFDIEQVRHSMIGRTLVGFNKPPSMTNRWLTSVVQLVNRKPVSLFFFRVRTMENTLGLGYIPYMVVSDAARRAHRAFFWLLVIAGLFVLLGLRYEEMVDGEELAALGAIQTLRDLPIPMLLIWSLAAILTGSVLVYALLASTPMEAEIELQSQEISGAKHPQMIYDYLEAASRTIEYDGMPNRSIKFQAQQDAKAVGVGESKSFERALLIEQQPRCLGGLNRVVAFVALFFAVGMIVWSFVALTGLYTEPVSSYYMLAATMFGGLVAYKGGSRFLLTATVLFDMNRFESIMIIADVRGSVSKSKVVVGRGHMDSVMSENETNRSELLITYYATRVVSESESLWSPRFLLSMAVDDDVRHVLHDLQTAIGQAVTSGVAIAGVEVRDHHLTDMVQMNVGLRHASRNDRALPGDVGGVPKLKPALPVADGAGAPDAGAKPSADLVNETVRLRMKARRVLAQFREVSPTSDSLEEAEAFLAEAEEYFDKERYELANVAYLACTDCCSGKSESVAAEEPAAPLDPPA